MALPNSVAKPHSLFSYIICFHTTVLLLLQVGSEHRSFSFSHPVVKFLPGFQGPLPFHLETGYVGVDEYDAVQLFYLFVKSERNPKEDPLLLWLVGGPRCSALTSFFYEIGPLKFELLEYNGSLPTLVLNPHSWTKLSSIIFVDLPVGTGFSYAKTTSASLSGDWKQIHHANQFLRKWLVDHPEFLSRPVYIGGDSYSGKTVPVLVQQISDGNEEGIKPLINLQGYILGNPVTEPTLEFNSAIPFAHGMALISDELYESLKRNCKGEYQNTDPSNIECLKYMQAYNKCMTGIEASNILMRKCAFAFTSQNPQGMIGKTRSLNENLKKFRDPELPLPEFGCHTYAYLLSHYWANDDDVRKALHIRKESAGEWIRCNYDLPYRVEIDSTVQHHVNLSSKGYRSLIYSGDHDMIVPFLATQAWIRSLNYSILDDWRPWIVKGQVAGYTRTYSNWMTFATVRGAGHVAIEFKPEECFSMFQRWISRETL